MTDEERWELLEELRELKSSPDGAIFLIRGIELGAAEAARRMGEHSAGMKDALDQLICCWAPYPGHGDPRFFLGEVVWQQDDFYEVSSVGGEVLAFQLPQLSERGPYHLVVSLDDD